MEQLLKVTGIIEFQPPDLTKKHKAQSWKNVAIIKTNCDIDSYYAWFLSKRFNLTLNKNVRGPHVTFISDIVNVKKFNEAAKIYNNKKIDFYLDLNPKSANGQHWWLRVFCPDAELIRESIGLNKTPYFGLHLTLGHVNEKNIEHSKYILSISKKFNLIPHSERKDLNEYTIL